MNKVLKSAWFATKAGIGGGALYITIDQGVWGDGRQASAAYDRLADIMPGTKNVSEKYLRLPKPDDVNINFRSYWNSGVFYTFDFVADLPSKVVGLKDTVMDFVSSSTILDKASEETTKTGTISEEKKVEDTLLVENVSPPTPAVSESSAQLDGKAE